PRSPPGGGPAFPPHLPPRVRLPEGHPQDPRARWAAGSGFRDLFGGPPGGVLFISIRPRKRLGRPRGLPRSPGAPRGGPAHGRQPLHLRGERDARAVADGLVGRLVERYAGARAGSVVGLLAPRAGGSADLLAAADARAASVVGATAPAVRRALAEGTWRGLAAAAGVVALGAVLFVAAAPASGRAAAFWHPLRTLADARAPVRVSVDRSAVRRGDG